MGLFDRFRRRARPVPEDPEQLREALFAAAGKGDASRVDELCRARRALIAASFPAWHNVPEPLRHDRRAVQRYAESLMAVAQAFQRLWGDTSLYEQLVAPPGENPLTQWDRKLTEARELMERLRFAEAKDLLTNLLIDVRDLQTFGTMCYPALTHGVLGGCLFGSGEVGPAGSHFERALQLCREYGDAEGVLAYAGSLYEVNRYLGRPAEAADYAGRHAAELRGRGRAKEAAAWERQSALVRAGEPLNRVVAVMGEERYEIDELPPLPVNTQVTGIFVRNRPSLKLCEGLTREGGRLAGTEGKYDDALEAFREAARVDPYDPQPRYDAGTTLMHLNRPAEAAEEFAATDELAPGWYQCRTHRWLAEEVAAGRVDPAVFLVLRLEDFDPAAMPAAERLGVVEQALDRSPDLAPLHLLRARLLAADGREADSAGACRAGLCCAREPDVKTRLLVQLHLAEPSKAERVRLLTEAVALRDTGNLLAASLAAIVLKTLKSS